ncbi:microtubule-associated protein [Blastocystis sp. subtype 4]|uniref:microtubule-associated protein n=1 Tax=Blastocystis sp. subtype 4 TaxID=944170 RepID=UPI000711C6C9|nr:microtubule-associated protein [Blastocystis sp. subtype 4]KNB42960.1 microtubule-associated protein [Blastocystis sp. subtype 4]|eukprot:XP_014526403.1 microtubule-associated protein [Blastocystis sp. subtype 4]
MSRINFAACDQFECQRNYRLLQSAFSKKSIPFNLDIDKLSKGRPQDNLELIQFMRDLFDRVYDGHKYDPIASRDRSKGGREWNVTSHDLEVMSNEKVVNSRNSIDTHSSQSRKILPLSTVPRRTGTTQSSLDALRELKGLQERIKVLEHDLRERDRLIESLGKEGTSMYHTMRMVEDHLLEAKEAGQTTVNVDTVLNIMYDNFKIEKPEEEEKWATEGMSIGHVDDSFEDIME